MGLTDMSALKDVVESFGKGLYYAILAWALTALPLMIVIATLFTVIFSIVIPGEKSVTSSAPTTDVYNASTPIKNIAEEEKLLEEDGKRRATMSLNDGYSLRSRTPKKAPRKSE